MGLGSGREIGEGTGRVRMPDGWLISGFVIMATSLKSPAARAAELEENSFRELRWWT